MDNYNDVDDDDDNFNVIDDGEELEFYYESGDAYEQKCNNLFMLFYKKKS